MTTLTLTGGLNPAIKTGSNVYDAFDSEVLLATIISGSGLTWTLSEAIGDNSILEPFNFTQPYIFTRTSPSSNTIITGSEGLEWTLSKSMNVPSVSIL